MLELTSAIYPEDTILVNTDNITQIRDSMGSQSRIMFKNSKDAYVLENKSKILKMINEANRGDK